MENVLDMDALPDLVVNAAYSPELGELKDEMDEIKGEVEKLHEEARDGWCSFGEKVHTKTTAYRAFCLVGRYTLTSLSCTSLFQLGSTWK